VLAANHFKRVDGVSAAGPVRVDQHLDRRLRRGVPPRRVQRPAGAGVEGTMSEAELHLIRSRLTAGLRHKAERGELRQGLPVGFDYDQDDRVVISSDEAVVEAIATVFRRFAEL